MLVLIHKIPSASLDEQISMIITCKAWQTTFYSDLNIFSFTLFLFG